VESGGDSGVKADLCSVNLAHADLTGVNLQGAVLNKANFGRRTFPWPIFAVASWCKRIYAIPTCSHGAAGRESDGATLYGAEGLWVGRLGGTNLFDAMLPEAVATFDGAKAIAQPPRFSRWIYFVILARARFAPS